MARALAWKPISANPYKISVTFLPAVLSRDGSFRLYCNNCVRRSFQHARRGRRIKWDAGASRVAFPRWSMETILPLLKTPPSSTLSRSRQKRIVKQMKISKMENLLNNVINVKLIILISCLNISWVDRMLL